ncbi:MAG: bifunctional diaminohydroxyphosphoribosylaminopyrimidine deaminase/5-amino-6-(5-phosphoribosylamino)uracil reductase RibD [Bacillota bacterium]
MNNQELYMKRALELAKGGWGKTNPNPLVGAVIVKNGKVIAEGFHEILGCAHAEVAAMNNAVESVEGGTLYVNLEPCSHYGRTPPCAEAIIKSGIKEVVIAMKDPNPKVSGTGIRLLEEAGLSVITGVLEADAKKLNEIFIKYITTKKPFVIVKSAMTLDGKIATITGDSKWISSESSRLHVHVVRDRVAAVMTGINTVLADNPFLSARLPHKQIKFPVRVIVDSKGRIPLDCNIIKNAADTKVIIATTSHIDEEKEKNLIGKGANIIKAEGRDGQVDLNVLMEELYKLEIDSVLIEGGGTLNAAALRSGIVDKVMVFIAPKIIGGKEAPTPFEGLGCSFIKDAFQLAEIEVSRHEDDILLEGYLR